MNTLPSGFTISNALAAGLTAIEQAGGPGGGDAVGYWARRMSQRALLLEAHHTTQSRAPTLALAPMSMQRQLPCIAEGHETR